MTNTELFFGLAKVLEAGSKDLNFASRQMRQYKATEVQALVMSGWANAFSAMATAALTHAKEG